MQKPTKQFLEELQTRQKKFCSKICTPHLFFSAQEMVRNNDVHFPFRQNSNFLYLTGFPEANSVALFEPDGNYTLFVEEKDPAKELWTGYRYGVEKAKEVFGANRVYPIKKLGDILPKLIKDQTITSAEKNFTFGKITNKVTIDKTLITSMRLIKSNWEIKQLKHASKISSQAHKKLIKNRHNFQYEYEFEALFSYRTIKRGALQMAYPAIVAGGANACTLHYTENNQKISSEQLVLIDAGCEINSYAADITRTFPIGKKFTPAQKVLYQIVLKTQKKVIKAVSKQTTLESLHQLACQEITSGLLDIKLLKGSLEKNLAQKTFVKYFPHRTGHMLGLDVHDCTNAQTNQQNLKAGMVFTVEPGIYIPLNDLSAPKEFRGIGIRIEDDILVTQTGCQNLTDVPKEIDELETI